MEDSFSFGSKSYFPGSVWLWGVHASDVIGMVKPTFPPNYWLCHGVCLVRTGCFWQICWLSWLRCTFCHSALHSSRSFSSSAGSLSSSLFLFLFFLFQPVPSQFSPSFPFSCSFHLVECLCLSPAPPFLPLWEGLCRGTPSLSHLRPPTLFSTLFFSS